jgi:hypothetical protein
VRLAPRLAGGDWGSTERSRGTAGTSLEDAHQGPVLEVRSREILSNVRQADTIEGAANHEFHIVHDQWTVDGDSQ